MDASIVYYTDNRLSQRFMGVVQGVIEAAMEGQDIELVVVAQECVRWGDQQITTGRKPACLRSVYEQMREGVLAASAQTIFACEHDVLYAPCYFDYRPPAPALTYNTNLFRANAHGWMPNRWGYVTSQLCADRDMLLACLEWRLNQLRDGKHITWAEPGRDDPWVFARCFRQAPLPSVDVRHGRNLTGGRKSHVYLDHLPHWGSHAAWWKRLGLNE